MKNYEKIRAELIKYNMDAVYVTSPVNRYYAGGFITSDGLVIITRDKQFYFTDGRYIEAATATMPDFNVVLVNNQKTYTDYTKELIESEKISIMGFEEEKVSSWQYTQMTKNFPVKFAAAQGIFKELRAVKSEDELEKMIAAQRIAEAALEQVLKTIKPGITENDVAAELIYRMLKLGADGLSFDPIVVAGVRSSMPHGTPTMAKIEPCSFVTMDFGCTKDGYCSDMTRTVAVGGCTKEMEEAYNVVLRAQKAGIEAAGPGVIGSAVHNAAVKSITDDGYGPYFTHGFGHGLGLEVHECNGAGALETKPLVPGNIISAEPGVYMPGKFGVRIEDVIIIRENGVEDITKAPKELLVL